MATLEAHKRCASTKRPSSPILPELQIYLCDFPFFFNCAELVYRALQDATNRDDYLLKLKATIRDTDGSVESQLGMTTVGNKIDLAFLCSPCLQSLGAARRFG
jgi:hypothetical protein